MTDTGAQKDTGRALARGINREFGAGLFLLAIAAAGYFAAGGLRLSLPSGVGPGLMPVATALIVGAFGILLMAQGLTSLGDRLDSWSIRGLFFLLGAVVFFGATIRTCGLSVAGPVAIVFGALADKDTRFKEIIPFALVLTAGCIVLFKVLLRQPIPIAPFLLGY